MKVNISRLHNMLEQISSDIRDKQIQISHQIGKLFCRGRIVFPILESTTKEDLTQFVEKVNNKRLEAKAGYDQIRQLLKYRKYIKETVAKLNASSGVLEKLLQVSILRNEKSVLDSIREVMQNVCVSELDEIKNVDYYKSSFTNDNKVYELETKMFHPSDVAEVTQEIEAIEKQIQDLNNQIAFTNQTTAVDISSFDEYISG